MSGKARPPATWQIDSAEQACAGDQPTCRTMGWRAVQYPSRHRIEHSQQGFSRSTPTPQHVLG
eukprot:4449266-Alexandrium_andersonii.AAC.1